MVRQIHTYANNIQLKNGPAGGFSIYNPFLHHFSHGKLGLIHLFTFNMLVRKGMGESLYLSVLYGTGLSSVGSGGGVRRVGWADYGVIFICRNKFILLTISREHPTCCVW